MRITCAPLGYEFANTENDLNVVLYGSSNDAEYGAVGAMLKYNLAKRRLCPDPRAWDLLSLALAVISSDLAVHRDRSPDGWTREISLTVAVTDAAFWNGNASVVERLLAFLTTDRWTVRFVGGGLPSEPNGKLIFPEEDSVALLSGGLDSYIGAIDLVAAGRRPLAVSQVVRGDARNQSLFAAEIGGGLRHLQDNHNAKVPWPENPPSQRARSIIFLAYGVLAATTTARYHAGDDVPLYVCENGFIAINPPLTGGRIGSLSTRTTHPVVMSLFQQLLDAVGLRVRVVNPYRMKTKGEMLRECADQAVLEKRACETTSCGRFKQFGYQHCGRCVPCLVRRAAFHAWRGHDMTQYRYRDLALDDKDHAGFDDVRSAMIGIAECGEVGIARWLGATLSSDLISDKQDLMHTVERGLGEMRALLTDMGVR